VSTERDFFEARYGHLGPERVAQERAAWEAEMAQRDEARKCSGGECQDIYRMCSKHSMEYQRTYGRASNE
jgi:hypothetical protein